MGPYKYMAADFVFHNLGDDADEADHDWHVILWQTYMMIPSWTPNASHI